MHTDYFAILADNLASELEIVQQTPGEFLSQYDEEFTTTANVVTATLVLVACAGFVMVSVYVDEHDAANKVTPLDSLKTQVIDRDDPKEKVLGTIFQAIRRLGFWKPPESLYKRQSWFRAFGLPFLSRLQMSSFWPGEIT
ncbi:unnamed protein product [Durusdinium trenchii]|uniref:Uncharacterized protein n=1 Tax=Durusdinium trenchii TaxID=1381693 RepID=A0ABP0IE84_9DINO